MSAEGSADPSTPPVSYAARVSSLGGGVRRVSFGGSKYDTTNLTQEDGEIDKALVFSKPSDVPLTAPFKIAMEADDEHYIAGGDVDEIQMKIDLSKEIMNQAEAKVNIQVDLAITRMWRMSPREYLEAKTALSTVSLEGESSKLSREALAETAIQLFRTEYLDLKTIIGEAIDTALHQDIFLHQETQFDIDMEIAKKRVLEVIEKEVKTQVDETVKLMESTKMSQIVADKPRISQGQQHFNETITSLKKLYLSYSALDKQYQNSISQHESAVNSLEDSSLTDEEKDAALAKAAASNTRSRSLEGIRDHKMTLIYQLLESSYPDIAGSAANAKQKQNPIAMHKLKVDATILSGAEDHTKSTKFIADLLQICQAWLPLFWALIPALMEVQQHDDKRSFLTALTFDKAKDIGTYGPQLGAVFETQCSQLWLVIARGNNVSMPELNLGSSESSMFPEIKTGGNGEQVRISNVEHKNVISLVLYIKHYHEKDIINDRRKNEAILGLAWSEFAEGSILKACERLLVHWQEAMHLGSEVKWHAFFQKSIVSLNDRCEGEMRQHLTKEYLNNEELKAKYADNCLPLWNKFISDVSAQARNMSNDNPKKYNSPEVAASKSSLHAFAGTMRPPYAGGNGKDHGNDVKLSDWLCGAKDCSEHISQSIKGMVLTSRAKRDDSSTDCPDTLLCYDHHKKHTAGTEIILKNGKSKGRASHQGKHKTIANSVSIDDKEIAKDADAEDAKKLKKKGKNLKRKTKMKAALALLRAKEAADSPEATPVQNQLKSPEVESEFDPGGMTAKDLAKVSKFLAGFSMASTAESSTPSSTTTAKAPPQQKSASASHGNVVKRMMGVFQHNGAGYHPTAVVNSVSAGLMYHPK